MPFDNDPQHPLPASADQHDYWWGRVKGLSDSRDAKKHVEADQVFQMQYAQRVDGAERKAKAAQKMAKRAKSEHLTSAVILHGVVSRLDGGFEAYVEALGFDPNDYKEGQDKIARDEIRFVRFAYRFLDLDSQTITNRTKSVLQVRKLLEDEMLKREGQVRPLRYEDTEWAMKHIGDFGGFMDIQKLACGRNPELPRINDKQTLGGADGGDDADSGASNDGADDLAVQLSAFPHLIEELQSSDSVVLLLKPIQDPDDPSGQIGRMVTYKRGGGGRLTPVGGDEDNGLAWKLIARLAWKVLGRKTDAFL